MKTQWINVSRHLLRPLLLAGCGLAAGCASMDRMRNDYNTEFETSGASTSEELLGIVAISVNPLVTAEQSGEKPEAQAQAKQFGEAFSRKFTEDFSARLRARGIVIHDPGRGVPLLRLYVSDFKTRCQDQQDCLLQVRIDGAAVDSTGKRVWWFYDWVAPGYMDATGYENLYNLLLKAMVKDQVIPVD